MEAQAAVYLTAKQNGKILQDKSLFTYTKYKVRGSSVYYYCSKKTVYNCKVTAKVDLSMEPNMITQINGEHEHDNDLLKVQVQALEKQAVENAANNVMVAPRTVLGNLSNNILATTSQGGFNYFNIFNVL